LGRSEGFQLPTGFRNLVWHALDLRDNVLQKFRKVNACDLAVNLNLLDLFGQYMMDGKPEPLLAALNPEVIKERLGEALPPTRDLPLSALQTVED
jgi:hypothetical protein